MVEHPNGGASIREVHKLLDELEERLAGRLAKTEERLGKRLDEHRDEHKQGSRLWLQVLTIVVAMLALMVSSFLGVLQIIT